jgi:hypothetical protein
MLKNGPHTIGSNRFLPLGSHACDISTKKNR